MPQAAEVPHDTQQGHSEALGQMQISPGRASIFLPCFLLLEGFFSMSWLLLCEAVGTGFPAGSFIFLPVRFIFYKAI